MSASWSSKTAGEAFAVVITEHVRTLQERLPAALADSPDGVHRLRAAVRRLRTVLSVYRPVFDEDRTAELRARLKQLGDVLGTARDLEVRRDDAEALCRAERVSADVRRRLVTALDAQHVAAHQRFVTWAQGDEMAALTAELLRWVADPPLGKASAKPARKVARKRLRKSMRKAVRAAAGADLEHLERAHRLRKSGRRVSHAARAVTRKPTKVLRSNARDLGAAGKQVQSSLGAHRDAMLLAAHVGVVADAVAARGGDRRPYDRLARAAEDRARELAGAAVEAVDALRATAS